MTGEGPHPAPDMWGILDKMAASVNIIAITAATWGLRGEGVKGVAGSRVVVFSRVGGWEGDKEMEGEFQTERPTGAKA